MKNTLLLILGDGAYNIYKEQKENYDFVFEVAGTGVGGFNAELNRLFGYDDDVSILYDTDVWQYILEKYTQKGICNILILTCLAGSSAKNLPAILQSSKILGLRFSVYGVVPFTWEGDACYENSLQLVVDLVEENISKIYLAYNDTLSQLYGNVPIMEAFSKFHNTMYDEIMEMKKDDDINVTNKCDMR